MGWLAWTDRWYWRIQPVLAPDLRNSQHEYADTLKTALPRARRWLDLGCGHEFLPPWMDVEERTLSLGGCRTVGVDADADALSRHRGLTDRIIGNIEALPFADGVFDLVTANMVIEHVQNPEPLFAEVHRILSPEGRLIVHTPNGRGYTTALARIIPEGQRAAMAKLLLGRDHRDVYPTYYRANTVEQLEALAGRASLAVDDIRLVQSSPQTIAIPPLLLLELGLARLLRHEKCASLRPCLVGVFHKTASGVRREQPGDSR
jgi:SAM-dependent methyltransferase